MGEMAEIFRDMKAIRRAIRRKYAIDCPVCKLKRPKSNPTKMLPGQRCKVDGYVDSRPRLTIEQQNEALKEAGLDYRAEE